MDSWSRFGKGLLIALILWGLVASVGLGLAVVVVVLAVAFDWLRGRIGPQRWITALEGTAAAAVIVVFILQATGVAANDAWVWFAGVEVDWLAMAVTATGIGCLLAIRSVFRHRRRSVPSRT